MTVKRGMPVSYELLERGVGLYFWALARISGFLLACPVTWMLPPAVRHLLALVLAGVVFWSRPALPSVPALSVQGALILASELLTGVLFGLVLHVWFGIFAIAGQLAGMQMGLGMAQMNDPVSGIDVTVVSQLYQLAAMLVFVLIGGHTEVLTVLVDSFRHCRIGTPVLLSECPGLLLDKASWMFSAAFVLAMPVLIALLIVNMGFGYVARTAPQLSLLTLGFPLSLLSGLVIISYELRQFAEPALRLTREAVALLRQLVQL